MADAGVGDILITYPILGEAKMRRLAALTASTSISIAADSPAAIDAAGAAAADAGRVIGFLVECDTGFGRLGVSSPAEAARLAALVAATPGLRFDGLMTYPTLEGSAALLAACRDAVEAVGLRVHVVSGGGTPTLYQTAELAGDVITEIRAGEYVFGDRTHLERGVVGAGELAAVVLTSVVGAPTDGRVILDAGSKTLSSDAAGEPVLRGFGLVAEYPDAVLYELSEEHAHVDVSRCATRPSIGERVAVIPNHICPCVNLAGRVLLRTASGTESVPVAARGVTGDRRDSREERR
jgi:D-serine deaminase-like pyridoxal phosphate-dependent protein